MKITDAWVDDPTLDGKLEKPMLCVQVDSLPDVSIEPTAFEGGWSVGKYGPFVRYSCSVGPSNAGAFNVRFRARFPAVVDILLMVSDSEKTGYSLNIGRARQLIKKYDPSWSLQVNDRAAMNGQLQWEPVQADPGCRHYDGDICGIKPTRTVHTSGIDLPLCSTHMTEHNARFASQRLNAS